MVKTSLDIRLDKGLAWIERERLHANAIKEAMARKKFSVSKFRTFSTTNDDNERKEKDWRLNLANWI